MGGIGQQEDNDKTENGFEYRNYLLTCYQPDCVKLLKAKGLDMYCVLMLDTASTVDQVCNPNLLTNINTVEKKIFVHCNARITKNKAVSCMEGLDMWLHTNRKMNVISIKSLMEKYHVTFDIREGNGSFLVHTTRRIVEFLPHKNSLYYLDLSKGNNGEVLFVQTMRQNYEEYAKREVEKTRGARALQERLGNLPQGEFEQMVRDRVIV